MRRRLPRPRRCSTAPDGLTRTFELPFGTVPGSVFVSIRTGDVLTHTWDLAKATKQDTDVDPELAGDILETVRAFLVPSLRGPGKAFGEEQPCPERCQQRGRPAAALPEREPPPPSMVLELCPEVPTRQAATAAVGGAAAGLRGGSG